MLKALHRLKGMNSHRLTVVTRFVTISLWKAEMRGGGWLQETKLMPVLQGNEDDHNTFFLTAILSQMKTLWVINLIDRPI